MNKKSNQSALNSAEDTRLIITAIEASLPKFFRLIQSGFKLRAVTGVTIRSFLCGQLGLSEDYLEERIQTLFLDSKPVDNTAKTRIRDGSKLALSAAMPGVAGALFRKDGKYSAMRKGISYKPQDVVSEEKAGWVTIRLFNLILKELGPFFLAKGVWIAGSVAQEFFHRPPQLLLDSIQRIEINGNVMASATLSAHEWSPKHIFIKVVST
jgi:hypothetical protein